MTHRDEKKLVTRVTAGALSKKYGGVTVFSNISLSVRKGESLAITGRNGSGKSTLLEILAGVKTPSSGEVLYHSGDGVLPRGEIRGRLGFLSPRLNPYGELTGMENIRFASGSRGREEDAEELLRRFELHPHRDKPVRRYSTGMRQRLKIILSLLHDPDVLLLDEPGSGLDEAGRKTLGALIGESKENRILVIATNDEEEARFCGRGICLG
jgi:heme exporter protein A